MVKSEGENARTQEAQDPGLRQISSMLARDKPSQENLFSDTNNQFISDLQA